MKRFLALCLAASCLFSHAAAQTASDTAAAQAADDVAAAQTTENQTAARTADKKTTVQQDDDQAATQAVTASTGTLAGRADGKAAGLQATTRKPREKKKKAPKARYAQILTDNGYRYDLDTRNLRWIPLPHSSDEYIIDVWVKLTQEAPNDGSDGTYTYPEKYYLAHYYVRPKTRQIQFLSELEVTGGRPDNTVKGRGYQAQNWEDLTPDSIEDAIYASAVKHAGKNRLGSASRNNMSIRDAVEEYLRVSF